MLPEPVLIALLGLLVIALSAIYMAAISWANARRTALPKVIKSIPIR